MIFIATIIIRNILETHYRIIKNENLIERDNNMLTNDIFIYRFTIGIFGSVLRLGTMISVYSLSLCFILRKDPLRTHNDLSVCT